MAEDKVKVRLRPGHGTRVIAWGAVRAGDLVEVPREAAEKLNKGVFEIVGESPPKTRAKSGGRSTASKGD